MGLLIDLHILVSLYPYPRRGHFMVESESIVVLLGLEGGQSLVQFGMN